MQFRSREHPELGEVLAFIRVVRESSPVQEYVFQFGSCFRFSQILAAVFPLAVPLSDQDHVITRIPVRGSLGPVFRYFDVTGDVPLGEHRFMDPAEREAMAGRCSIYYGDRWGGAKVSEVFKNAK